MALELRNDTYIPEIGIANRLETGRAWFGVRAG
jgi:hypothetical protein